MRVICIDNKSKTKEGQKWLSLLKEGNIYTVIECTRGAKVDGYVLAEVPTINPYGFARHLFIPLSDINELGVKREFYTSHQKS